MQNDLAGILVISVEQAVAAPYASCKLADAGARVIKIERPEGDFARRYDTFVKGQSAYFVWLNRGKESVCLDLKQTEDVEILRRMISRADVLIQNLGPGAFERLGLNLAALRAAKPRLITCSISGYGPSGPYRDQKAYDLLVQAESGLTSITGNAEGSARIGVSVCDIAAGMTAFQAILQALFARERTGVGKHIDVSLYHALSDWMNVPYLQFIYGGHTPELCGLNHPTITPYGAYTCGDGKVILFSIQNEREWAFFCEHVLKAPQIAHDSRFNTNPNRLNNRPALNEIIDAAFSKLSRDDVVARLDSARVAYGRVSTLDDLAAHPQNRYVDIPTPGGTVRQLAPGATFNDESQTYCRVPALGEHTAAVRKEFN